MNSALPYDLRVGDCLDLLGEIPPGSVDLVLADLPYGEMTDCDWDSIIPLEPLWGHYRRLLKPLGAVVLTATQPFTSMLVLSNRKWYRHCWVWDKVKPGTFHNAKVGPLRSHEDIVVFAPGSPPYNPIKVPRPRPKVRTSFRATESAPLAWDDGKPRTYTDWYPKSIIRVSNADQNGRFHPTQKPVALFEYLIRTYSNEGDLVLDNAMGSGTTLLACLNTGRRGIGIDIRPDYVEIARRRLDAVLAECPLLPVGA